MENIKVKCIFNKNTNKDYKMFIINLFELYMKTFLEEEYINIDKEN